MFNRTKLTLSHRRLMGYMTDELGMDQAEARGKIAALRRADPVIIEAFLDWFYNSRFPEKPLYHINVQALCDRRGLDPVTAFLTVDWARREPKAAVEVLTSTHDELLFDDAYEAHMQELLDKKGWTPEPSKDAPTDESDLSADPVPSDGPVASGALGHLEDTEEEEMRFDIGAGYFISYIEKDNQMGGYYSANISLYRGGELIRRITDEEGRFLDFPGVEHGDWEKLLKRPFEPVMRFYDRYIRFGEEDTAVFIWCVQPDGRYWADDDGFGWEDDDEVELYAKLDKTGRFVTPFRFWSNDMGGRL